MDWTSEQVLAQLGPRPARYLAQAASSNDLALMWLKEGAPAGAVVIVDEQTRGRGRLGRSWYAPPGTALMLSYVLRPTVSALPRISMLGALAVCELLETLGIPEVGIKWPNDVQIGGRKVCGVLPESAWDGDQLAGVVLGIGLNVRIDFTGTPFAETATSLGHAASQALDRMALLRDLLARLDYWAARVDSPLLLRRWRERLNMLGRLVTVSGPDGMLEGTADAVDEDGALLLRLHDGRLKRVIAGDIALG
jgi:BirA family biotin operon repressor/biotin-[acetyl-CoA-carboxylase] ligase